MSRLRRQYGFWRSLGGLHLRDLLAPEIFVGVIVGVMGTLWLVHHETVTERSGIAADYLLIAGPLLGIVFAGFALVIALLADDYLRQLEETESGVVGFLRPFMISIGLQVGAFLAAIAYRAVAAHVSPKLEHWLFGIVTVLFLVAALDVVALARSVLMHGVARGRMLKVHDLSSARSRDRSA